MTALTKDTKPNRMNPEDSVPPLLMAFPVAAATTIYGGAIGCVDASGNAVSGASATAVKVWGRCEQQVINSGSAGAVYATYRPGVYAYPVGTGGDALTAADIGSTVYVIDDQTVGKTAGAGRIVAGTFYGLDLDGKAFVGLGVASLSAGTSPAVGAAGTVSTIVAKNAIVTNVASLAAYTVATGAQNDNVANVEKDVVLLVNQTSHVNDGLYVVGPVTTGTATLTRIASVPAGLSVGAEALNVRVLSGTLFGGSVWKNTAAGVVGTGDLAFYPSTVTQSVLLVSGTATITNVPVLSATKTLFTITRTTPVGTALTVAYNAVSITPGELGTATFAAQAQLAAGTINTADGSTVTVNVTNF